MIGVNQHEGALSGNSSIVQPDSAEVTTPDAVLLQQTNHTTREVRKASLKRPYQFSSPEMNEVLPHVYISGLVAAHNVGLLRKHQIRFIVSTMSSSIREIDGEVNKHQSRLTKLNIPRVIVPIRDIPSENIVQQASEVLEQIHEHVQNKNNVLIHCHCGISRSVSVACMYAMKYMNLHLLPALERIQSVRPQANPNVGFRLQLKKWERQLFGLHIQDESREIAVHTNEL